jgi:hypothetical protein
MAGRYEQLMAIREERPFWQYLHSDAVEHPRPLHEAWDGMVLRWDDPWWRYHFPINAWGCQCGVRALSASDLARMGKSGPDTAPPIVMEQRTIGQRSPGGPRVVEVPQGIDPGFEYVPGQSRYVSQVPPQQPPPPAPTQVPAHRAPDPLPPPRPAPVMPTAAPGAPGASAVDAAESFLRALGTGTGRAPAVVRDVIGERLVVGPQMFSQPLPVLPAVVPQLQGELMASALLQPDEIWTGIEWFEAVARAVVRRRYVARYRVEGVATPVTIVLDLGANGWWVLPQQTTRQQLDALRTGVLLYARED